MSKKLQEEAIISSAIGTQILLIRGQRVILDADLAQLYGTTTKRLNEQVRRNIDRFPVDFMFQLTSEELEAMRSQIATASKRNVRYSPYAFTEHGAIMAASILNTSRAIEVSVYVVRAFIKLRELLSAHKELAGKLAELERKVAGHDGAIESLVVAIRRMMSTPPSPPRARIGFHAKPKDAE